MHFLVPYNVTAKSQITADRGRHISVTAPLGLQVNPVQKVQCFLIETPRVGEKIVDRE